MGGGLSRGDIRWLTRAYLQQLGEEVDGDESKCMDRDIIFDKMPLKAFGRAVIPTVVQEPSLSWFGCSMYLALRTAYGHSFINFGIMPRG